MLPLVQCNPSSCKVWVPLVSPRSVYLQYALMVCPAHHHHEQFPHIPSPPLLQQSQKNAISFPSIPCLSTNTNYSSPNAKAPTPAAIAAAALAGPPVGATAPLFVAVALAAELASVNVPVVPDTASVYPLPVTVPPPVPIVPLTVLVPGCPKQPVRGPRPPHMTPLLMTAVAPKREMDSWRFSGLLLGASTRRAARVGAGAATG